MKRAVVVGVVLFAACLVFASSGLLAQRAMVGTPDGSSGASTVPVTVSNFPQVQPVQVDKTVNVTGSVAVTNLPAVQDVAGSVNVGNLPVDADGNVRVSASAPSIRFIGYTQGTHREGSGFLELSRACDAEFSGSRMCEGMELARMSPPPPAANAPAMLVLFGSTTPWGSGTATIPVSSCMSAEGVPFACGGDALPVACCGY